MHLASVCKHSPGKSVSPHCIWFGDPWLLVYAPVFLGSVGLSADWRLQHGALYGLLTRSLYPIFRTECACHVPGPACWRESRSKPTASFSRSSKAFCEDLVLQGQSGRETRGENNPLSHTPELGTPGKSSILARHTNHKPGNGKVRLQVRRAFISGHHLGTHS